MIEIRTERPHDRSAVFEVEASAFATDAEARLVDALRESTSLYVSLVAVEADRIVGHIFFSPLTIRGPDGDSGAFGLAPVAVRPEMQRAGIGSSLCRTGLAACGQLGEPLVFVLGQADYYPRFGFRRADAHGLYYERPGDNPSFMVAELQPGALAGRSGEVCYAPEFYAL